MFEGPLGCFGDFVLIVRAHAHDSRWQEQTGERENERDTRWFSPVLSFSCLPWASNCWFERENDVGPEPGAHRAELIVLV
jgi:hypothetical protein